MKNKIILLSVLLSINIHAEQFVASAGKGINLSGTLIKNSISENTNNEENNEADYRNAVGEDRDLDNDFNSTLDHINRLSI